METTIQYPTVHIDVTLDDISVTTHLKTLLKQMKGVRAVSVKMECPKAEMTEDEFYAKIDHSLQQAAEGKVYRSMPGESADAFLDRLIAMGD